MSKHSWFTAGKSTDAPEATQTIEATEATEATESTVDEAEVADEPKSTAADDAAPAKAKRGVNWARAFAYGVLPALALLLAVGACYLKWQDNSIRNAESASDESVQTATDSTVAILSYDPDTVEQQLNSARDLLTGEFRDSYTGLINDVVIPGAKQRQISAVATVPAAASVSADSKSAVVLVFINQTVVVGQTAPTDTASSVRVTLEKSGDRWLISKFDPV